MVVAVCALLVASGRADFSENEIEREVEILAADLRARYGFSETERAGGAELWAEVLALLEETEIPDSTLALWIRPFHSPGLAGGRLWLTAEGGSTVAWTAKRYRGLIDRAIELRRPDEKIRAGFMAFDPREDGQP